MSGLLCGWCFAEEATTEVYTVPTGERCRRSREARIAGYSDYMRTLGARGKARR